MTSTAAYDLLQWEGVDDLLGSVATPSQLLPSNPSPKLSTPTQPTNVASATQPQQGHFSLLEDDPLPILDQPVLSMASTLPLPLIPMQTLSLSPRFGTSFRPVSSFSSASSTASSSTVSESSREVKVPSVKQDPFLVPRQYQTELFHKAEAGNVIAVMDTGSGKTLVAVMLIREMLRREKEAQRGPKERKLSFFIVNNVPLVFQQAAVIRANCDAEVTMLCGAMDTKKFSDELWGETYKKVDVVVVTAQILLDLFRHGFVQMSRVNLLIFDECHHARKDHPFCCIMKEFYHVHELDHSQRPKVFGMTASPSSDIGSKLYHTASELENLMDAKVFTVDQEEVKQFVERPLEFVVQYNPAPGYRTTKLTSVLRSKCFMIPRLNSIFESVQFNLSHLGSWCVDSLWRINVENMVRRDGGIKQLPEEIRMAYDVVKAWTFPTPTVDIKQMSPKVMKLIQILRVAGKSWTEDFCGIIFVQRRDTAIALCLLLQELEEFREIFRVQVLAGHSDESDSVLKMKFQEQNDIISNFRSKVYNLLVSTSVAEEGLDIQPCNVVIRFDPVTTTISYIQSRGRARQKNSRYIMMMEYDNRGEEAALEKIQIGEKSMRDWCHSLDSERLMRKPASIDEDEGTELMDMLTPSQSYRVPTTGALLTLDSAIPLLHYYCSSLTGDEFCSLRPEFSVTANGSSGFICDLTLPPNAPVRIVQSDRTSTKQMARKSAAFKACELLHSLKALNDNLLPVVVEEVIGDSPVQSGPVEVIEKNRVYPYSCPEIWKQDSMDTEAPVTLHKCVIEMDERDVERLGGKHRFRLMCILTRQPLPNAIAPIRLYLEGAGRLVNIKSHLDPVTVEKEQLLHFQKYTLLLFQRMCRKSFECSLESMPYFVVPLCIRNTSLRVNATLAEADLDISWEDVKSGQKMQPDPVPIPETEDEQVLQTTLLALRKDPTREFFFKKIVTDYKMQDLMPPDAFRQELAAWDESLIKIRNHTKRLAAKATAVTSSSLEPSTTTTSPSSPSLSDPVTEEITTPAPAPAPRTFAAYFKWKFQVDCEDGDKILMVDRVRKMRNHLQPAVREEEAKEEAGAMMMPLKACIRGTVKADILRMAQLVPSILFSLDQTLLVYEARDLIGLRQIRLDYLQEAFTTSSSNRDYQYERLELLGDSFLKFSSTIRLYIVNPAKDEGQLHASRIRIISNKALLDHATSLELYRFISSTPFHRKSWRPPYFTVDKREWESVQKHQLSNKTLADVIEATLGAAFLSGGYTVAFQAAKALRIPFDEFATWGDFGRVFLEAKAAKEASRRGEEGLASSLLMSTPLSMANLAAIQEVQKILGYEFKDPSLFFEAMTHASHIRADAVCYQRLEFLGDAVLDFQVIRYYYEKYYDAPPGAITLIKDASVNNGILGAISLKWGLQKFLNHYSPSLIGAISRAMVSLEERASKSPTGELEKEYWVDICMPKVLGDLVESTLGAVFVDSGFNFELITDLFRRLIMPFLDKHVNFEGMVLHPNKVLLESLQHQGCSNFKFETETTEKVSSSEKLLKKLGLGMRSSNGSRNHDDGEPVLKCHFKIHERTMATAVGKHMEDLRKEVSLATLAILKKEPELMVTLCTCPKKRGARHVSMLDRYRQE
ncbi:Dicer-like protein 1 [Linnemannia schmuckeri]|uniref:Dicer-like protein 1 n=1 Tax=Linnemannia schmuckeri TaxID=64567 RepID=A0A9P5RV30_9FUNG|nr:Dicer-like protein 1 [Linnemannia schmuckeri]